VPDHQISTLVDEVCCPRCRRRSVRIEAEELRGIAHCHGASCEQRWWVMRLRAGDVEPQLAIVFSYELAKEIVSMWKLPARLTSPKYWQISLTKNQLTENNGRGSHRLLSMLIQVLRSRITLVPSRRRP
jgi:hypothetical protein